MTTNSRPRAAFATAGRLVLLASTLATIPGRSSAAQVGDVSWVVYPGWLPSDRVAAIIGVSATYDPQTQLWTYAYRLLNRSWGEQPIITFDMTFAAPKSSVTVPTGWYSIVTGSETTQPGVGFAALLRDDIIGDSPNGPATAQIPVNGELEGFSFTSTYPPGHARTYVKGFAPVPYLPDDYDEAAVRVPDDTTDAQRTWVPAPTLYQTVRSAGGVQAGVEGFVGFMNMDTLGTIQETPAIVALKFFAEWRTGVPRDAERYAQWAKRYERVLSWTGEQRAPRWTVFQLPLAHSSRSTERTRGFGGGDHSGNIDARHRH